VERARLVAAIISKARGVSDDPDRLLLPPLLHACHAAQVVEAPSLVIQAGPVAVDERHWRPPLRQLVRDDGGESQGQIRDGNRQGDGGEGERGPLRARGVGGEGVDDYGGAAAVERPEQRRRERALGCGREDEQEGRESVEECAAREAHLLQKIYLRLEDARSL